MFEFAAENSHTYWSFPEARWPCHVSFNTFPHPLLQQGIYKCWLHVGGYTQMYMLLCGYTLRNQIIRCKD